MVKGRMVQFETDCTACYKRVKNVVCLELGSATIRLCRECRPLVIDELKLFQERVNETKTNQAVVEDS